MSEKIKEARIVVMVPEKMKLKFAKIAKSRGRTLAYVIRMMINDYNVGRILYEETP